MAHGVQRAAKHPKIEGDLARAAFAFQSEDDRLLNLREGQEVRVTGFHDGTL